LAFGFGLCDGEGRDNTNWRNNSTADGYAVGFRFQRLEWHGGYHTFGIQYGKGAASNFSTSSKIQVRSWKKYRELLIAEHLLVQPNDRFAIMPIFLFQRKRDGQPGHGFNDWASFGVRAGSVFYEELAAAPICGAIVICASQPSNCACFHFEW